MRRRRRRRTRSARRARRRRSDGPPAPRSTANRASAPRRCLERFRSAGIDGRGTGRSPPRRRVRRAARCRRSSPPRLRRPGPRENAASSASGSNASGSRRLCRPSQPPDSGGRKATSSPGRPAHPRPPSPGRCRRGPRAWQQCRRRGQRLGEPRRSSATVQPRRAARSRSPARSVAEASEKQDLHVRPFPGWFSGTASRPSLPPRRAEKAAGRRRCCIPHVLPVQPPTRCAPSARAADRAGRRAGR